MAKYMDLKINNSKGHAVNRGKWKDPGAKLYDQLLEAFHCVDGVPIDGKQMEEMMKNGKYIQWPTFLQEAYLVAPVNDIKNSPYGVTQYSRSGCKYPHHIIRNGELVVSIPGLEAAYDRAFRYDDLHGSIGKHLNKHMKELGLTNQWHHGKLYWNEEAASWDKIEKNFDSIYSGIFEQTGIDLTDSQTSEGLNSEDYIRPLNKNDVTKEYFLKWFFKMDEFENDSPENFDFNVLVDCPENRHYCYGYFIDNKLEGIIRIRYSSDNVAYGISMLFVDTDKQHIGIGNSLMKHAISLFGSNDMILRVFEFNTNAISLYEKYGFVKFQEDIYKDGPDSDPKFVGKTMYLMKRDAVKSVDDHVVDPIENIKESLNWIESLNNKPTGGEAMLEESDDLDWITSFLMEDAETPPPVTPVAQPANTTQPVQPEAPAPEPATPTEPVPLVKEESLPKKTDKAESSKNGIRRKNLYIAFITWCKEYNNKNTFGSIFDKDAFNVSYPFIPEDLRYFYRLANPMLCVLAGELTFFAVAELRKLNAKNSHIAEMLIFAATPNDVRVFNVKDKKVYRGTEENGTLKLNEILGDTFDTYIQKMINKGDILNASRAESTEFVND